MALHRGFTLYNIGTCTGFLGVILYMIMEGFELTIQARVQWATIGEIYLRSFALRCF